MPQYRPIDMTHWEPLNPDRARMATDGLIPYSSRQHVRVEPPTVLRRLLVDADQARHSRTAIGTPRIPCHLFVEQHAGEARWLLTKKLVQDGSVLRANYHTDGESRIELSNYPSQALPDYSLADRDPIASDHFSKPSPEPGSPTSGGRRDRPAYTLFHLPAADTWTFRVT